MIMIALALENGNPFAYLLLFLLLCPPIMVIIFAIINKIIDKMKKH